LAVSRTTEIETPSPWRAASSTCSAVIAARSSDDVLHARSIAGLDAPDQAADDAGRGNLGLQTTGLSVVLALDRVERHPRERPCSPARTGEGSAVPDDPARGVLADRKQHHVLDAARRADPGFRRCGRRSREHRTVPVDGAAELRREFGDHRRDRRRLGVDGGHSEQRCRGAGHRSLNLLERLHRGARQIAARVHSCASQHLTLVVDADNVDARVIQLHADHSRPHSVLTCIFRPASGSATGSSASSG
jgi:hypothetical protein